VRQRLAVQGVDDVSPEQITRAKILGTLRRNLQGPGLIGTRIEIGREVDLEKLADQLWIVALEHATEVLKPVMLSIDEMVRHRAAERARIERQLRSLWALAALLLVADIAQAIWTAAR
jgi:hypothetical protein